MENSKNTSRSIHISYEYQNRDRLHQLYLKLIAYAAKESIKAKSQFHLLDLGCGRGDFLKTLLEEGYCATGLDFDHRCAEMANNFGNVKVGRIEDVDTIFRKERFDMVVLSHVLEHLKNPADAIEKVKSLKPTWLLIAVPNPLRPKVLMKYNFFSRDYSNKGHYYSWDRSHFTNFLTRYCGLEIVKFCIDEVYLIPSRWLRKFLKLFSILDILELIVFPRILPYFSSSLIVLCKIDFGERSLCRA